MPAWIRISFLCLSLFTLACKEQAPSTGAQSSSVLASAATPPKPIVSLPDFASINLDQWFRLSVSPNARFIAAFSHTDNAFGSPFKNTSIGLYDSSAKKFVLKVDVDIPKLLENFKQIGRYSVAYWPTSGLADFYEYAWSQDSRYLVISANVAVSWPSREAESWKMPKRLLAADLQKFPTWVSYHPVTFLVDTQQNSAKILDLSFHNSSGSFSDDQTKLFFFRTKNQSPLHDCVDIFEMDLATGDEKNLTQFNGDPGLCEIPDYFDHSLKLMGGDSESVVWKRVVPTYYKIGRVFFHEKISTLNRKSGNVTTSDRFGHFGRVNATKILALDFGRAEFLIMDRHLQIIKKTAFAGRTEDLMNEILRNGIEESYLPQTDELFHIDFNSNPDFPHIWSWKHWNMDLIPTSYKSKDNLSPQEQAHYHYLRGCSDNGARSMPDNLWSLSSALSRLDGLMAVQASDVKSVSPNLHTRFVFINPHDYSVVFETPLVDTNTVGVCWRTNLGVVFGDLRFGGITKLGYAGVSPF